VYYICLFIYIVCGGYLGCLRVNLFIETHQTAIHGAVFVL
jgi:hypothetical protein